ncbi:MAG: hypothetical protein QOG01_2045 [Pseudonocardiales bacterium]|nr:hypothetical protein [Pseudonocardiales bacterium]
MARLIVLNGPPGIGKSTLAQRYVDDHPLALNLDIDSIRRLLGGWRDDAPKAGLVARVLTLTMARQHLADGYDVVLPQFLGRPQFLQQAEEVAADVGAAFFEFVLMDNRDDVLRRFAERSAAAREPAHVEAGQLVASLGGEAMLAAMYDRLLLMLSSRPRAQSVHCPERAVDEVYHELISRIEA